MLIWTFFVCFFVLFWFVLFLSDALFCFILLGFGSHLMVYRGFNHISAQGLFLVLPGDHAVVVKWPWPVCTVPAHQSLGLSDLSRVFNVFFCVMFGFHFSSVFSLWIFVSVLSWGLCIRFYNWTYWVVDVELILKVLFAFLPLSPYNVFLLLLCISFNFTVFF